MTGRFPRASTSADASGARRRRGHPTDPAQPPSSSPARLFAPRRSRPRSSSVSRARRDGMPRPPRTELRGRNGAPIFLRSQFPRQEDVAPIARFPTRAHRANGRSVTQEKRLRVPPLERKILSKNQLAPPRARQHGLRQRRLLPPLPLHPERRRYPERRGGRSFRRRKRQKSRAARSRTAHGADHVAHERRSVRAERFETGRNSRSVAKATARHPEPPGQR